MPANVARTPAAKRTPARDLTTLDVKGRRSSASSIFAPLTHAADWIEPFRSCCTDPASASEDTPKMLWRPPECYVDLRTGDLGPYIRLTIALKLLLRHARRSDVNAPPNERWTTTLQVCEDTARDRLTEQLGLLSGEDDAILMAFDRVFLQDKLVWKQVGRYLHGALFERIVERLQAIFPHRPTLTLADLLDVRNLRDGEVLNPQTLKQFEHWLRHGVHPPSDDLRHLMCEHFIVSPQRLLDPRARQLQHVCGLLRTAQGDRPVLNIYAENCSTGLRAFATAVLDRLATARGDGDPDRPMGLIYIRLSRSSEGVEAPTPASILRQLRRAFGMPVPPRDTPHDRPIDLFADLEDVRRALTTHRTIIVADGLASSQGPIAALFDLMRNTHWTDFLRVLVQPHEDTLLAQGEGYPSRLLVLSNEPVRALAPWMQHVRPLRAVSPDGQVRQLLQSPCPFDAELRQTAQRLGARPSTESLHLLYRLEPDQQAAIFEGRPAHQLPDELDLALARLHTGDDLRAMRQLHTRTGRFDIAGFRRAQLGRWMHDMAHHDEDFVPLLAIKFIACCINGLRMSTLRRCMRHWLAIAPGLTVAQKTRLQAFLRNSHHRDHPSSAHGMARAFEHLLILNRDEDVEALGARQRRYELQALPDDRDAPDDADEDRILLDIRLEELRELVFAEMVAGRNESHMGAPSGRDEWELIHLCLAEEALRQASSQLRNVHTRETTSPYVYRRLIQAVFHGLLSHSYDDEAAAGRLLPRPPLRDFTLSADPFHRFRYLWVFLFRDCIDNAPDWLLGRGFARSEIRFALLAMFTSPRFGLQMLSTLFSMKPRQRAMRGIASTQPGGALADLFRDPRPSWVLRDESLQADILEAFGRTAYDTGRHRLVEAVVRVVKRERAAMAGTAAALPAPRTRDRHDPLLLSFEKLLIDSRQARAHLTTARRMCVAWLSSQSIDVEAIADAACKRPAKSS